MDVANPVPALQGATDFSVVIAWQGPEDKPFYRAMLVSQSRSSQVGDEPFWGYAVISSEELNRLVAVLHDHHKDLVSGSYNSPGPEYYVEVEADGGTYHCSLGFDPETLTILTELADALESTNRKPLQDILNRIAPSFKGTSP